MTELLARTRWAVLLAAVVGAIAILLPTSAGAISGTQKWAIVLCNFSNETQQPYSLDYYRRMFEGSSSSDFDFVDYWRDVSYGNLSVTGTTVTGWHTLGITRDAWAALDRNGKRQRCGDQAAADGFDFTGYYGFVVLFPEVKATLGTAMNTTTTSITVTDAAPYSGLWPTPPFLMYIDDGSLPDGGNSEGVTVTAISGTTFTITRAAAGTTAKSHNNGATIGVPGDIFGQGPTGWTFGGRSFTMGSAVLPSDVNLTGAAHETGHGFGYPHSRKLSTSTTDYADCFDVMSAYNTCSGSGDFGASNLGSVVAAKGPGITSIYLNRQGWLPTGAGSRVVDLDNSACNQSTVSLSALNHGDVVGPLAARIPAAITINTPGSTTTTSDFYWLEYRERNGWDSGLPGNGIVLHLHGADGYAYWVDTVDANGWLAAGEEFVNAPQRTYVAVNSVDTAAHRAQLTMGGCKLNASFTYTGDTTGDYNDRVQLSGRLSVAGSGAPIPSAAVTLSLGSLSCSTTTNAAGLASCSPRLVDHPGSYTASVSFAGDAAYNSASASVPFTITREESQVTYDGVLTSDYHDAFVASARLVDPVDGVPIAGKTIVFTLGVGDSCSAVTDGSGAASCSITPNQPAGTVPLVASFAGDVDYVSSSDTRPFEITREETTVTYTGPTVILQGSSGTTLQARLLEDGNPAAPIAGRTLTLGLGGQSCTGTTNAAGVASCSLTFTGALGPEPLSASFAGDAYYLPSSDTSATAIVFAFPSRGAFVLGDGTVAAAGPATTVAWWSDGWSTLNVLGGGAAPAAFKGFASGVSSLPTSTPPAACAGSWSSSGGNSPPPVSSVPSYMGVIVAGSASKSGRTISGTFAKIVVVRTDAGYAPNPGHAGTGTIVATYCG